MFTGVYTALITPFKGGRIDYASLEKIIEMQIEGGVNGVLPMGTTGESPTLSHDEHKEFIRTVVKQVNKRITVIAGTGSNSTEEAIDLSKSAADDGVDAVMLVNPYYNKPPQRGLVEHFASVAKSVSLPVILYNIPGRTGINFQPESIRELLDRAKNVVTIKEASGNLVQMMNIIELCGDRLTLLSGDDNLLLPVLAIGGKGVISVLANLLPGDMKRVVTDFEKGEFEEARKLFYRLLPLCRAMFYETNPIPIKAAMELMGYCSSEMRLPLVSLSDENRNRLRQVMSEYGLSL
jgi:4-hydroxy-tetrahydrodipicolinate synthase